uniref:Uncharacterized protein n=1 Tax=Anguilla anguilla TaxID=7936 RepID=A0A0E9SFK8_ANGAN
MKEETLGGGMEAS